MYKRTWQVLACMLTSVWAAANVDSDAAELRCNHELCVAGGGVGDVHYFSVEDHDIEITYSDWGYVSVDCDGSRILESLAMPRFTRLVLAWSVELSRCPPPAAGSLADVLSAINVTLQHGNNTGDLTLTTLPPEPPIAARHFVGLEHIKGLVIHNSVHSQALTPAAGFLSKLQSLQRLELSNVRLPAGELVVPPPGLRWVKLSKAGAERLPAAFLALPHLQELVVKDETTGIDAIFEVPPPALRKIILHSTNTTLRLDELPAVEDLSLLEWTERRPPALKRCDVLRNLQLKSLAAEALPERWVTACSHLEVLTVEFMRKVVSLPPNLLEGASSLTRLSFSNGVLETLPEGLLDGLPKLDHLQLNGNRLQTIPSGAFLGPRGLTFLKLTDNQLERGSLAALAPLQSLVWLGLSNNPGLGDLCDYNGYSPLLHLARLKILRLSGTNITRICRDWRESLTSLFTLELKNTKITELGYIDFQYVRDRTMNSAQVRLEGAPIKSVRFTEDDYKRSLTAPASVTWVHVDARLDCDCRMYWTRLVEERARNTLLAKSLLCTGNRNLSEATDDNVCVPMTNVTAAAIKALL